MLSSSFSRTISFFSLLDGRKQLVFDAEMDKNGLILRTLRPYLIHFTLGSFTITSLTFPLLRLERLSQYTSSPSSSFLLLLLYLSASRLRQKSLLASAWLLVTPCRFGSLFTNCALLLTSLSF